MMIKKIWNYQDAILNSPDNMNSKVFLLYIPLIVLDFGELDGILQAVCFSTAIVCIIKELLYSKAMTIQLTPASTAFKTANLYLLNIFCVVGIHLVIFVLGGCFLLLRFLWQYPESLNSFSSFMGEQGLLSIDNEMLLLYGLYFMNSMISTTAILVISNKRKQCLALMLCAICITLAGIVASMMDIISLITAMAWLVSILLPIYVVKRKRI